MQVTAALAQEWWQDRSPEGIFRGPGEFSDAQWDRAQAITGFLDDQATKNPDSLTLVLEILARAAPSSSALAFLGTWFMENAFPALGDSVFVALDNTELTDEQKVTIRSGFVW